MVKSYKWHKKESLIDHIYVNDISTIINVKFEVPTFSDHVLVIAELDLNIRRTNKNKIARDWKKYSVNSINVEVSSRILPLISRLETDVQSHWSLIEHVLIKSIDSLCPLITFTDRHKIQTAPPNIRNKINKRKRLLRLDKLNKNLLHMPTIKSLTKEIKLYFSNKLLANVKRAATGPKGNLWRAVKKAKNLVHDEIPSELTLVGLAVAPNDVANSFANHFHSKVKTLILGSKLNANV